MVKANAYGHNMVQTAKALQGHADAFGVATIEEAQLLRSVGIEHPILLAEGPHQECDAALLDVSNFWPMIHSAQQLEWVLKSSLKCPLWIKFDSGMHRLGFDQEGTQQTIKKVLSANRTPVLTTHFACADEIDNSLTQVQIESWKRLQKEFNCQASAANSAAIVAWPESHADWNRPGFMLYGASPINGEYSSAALTPVMHFSSEVIALRQMKSGDCVGYGATWTADKDSTIATVAVGYGDGYPRTAKNGTPVVVEGQRASIVGRVSMDLISIDVTHLKHVKLGSAVELWGARLPVNEVAEWAGTSGYELLTRMPARARREYIGG